MAEVPCKISVEAAQQEPPCACSFARSRPSAWGAGSVSPLSRHLKRFYSTIQLQGCDALCCAGMPEEPRRTSSETAPQEAPARAGSVARPEEVSAFRMGRRKRSSSFKAPKEAAMTPVEAVKAMEPAAPTSSPTNISSDDDKLGESCISASLFVSFITLLQPY